MKAGSKLHPGDAPTGSLVLATLIAIGFLFPLGYLAWSSIELGGNLFTTLASSDTLRPLWNSIRLALLVTVACALLGTTLAFLVTRTDLPLARLWRVLLPLPLVIPSFVGATAVLAMFGRGALVAWIPRFDGFWGAFTVLTLLSYPYVYLPVAARLRTTTVALEEASQLLGGGSWKTLRRVVWPQISGSATAGMLLVFLYVISDFGAVALLRYDTITRAIFSARVFDRQASITLGLVLALLALGIAYFERRHGNRHRPLTEVGRTQRIYRLSRWRWPTTLIPTVTLALALAAPIAVFGFWVLRGGTSTGPGFSGLGDDLGFLVSPIFNSAFAGVVAGLAAVVLTIPVAYVAAHGRNTRLATLASTAVTATFALPGLVIALAVVFWAIAAPSALAGLYQTFPLLIIAYVIHFGAQSMRTSQAALDDMPATYSEAARTLGAGAFRRFVTVELPLIRPAIIAGGGLVMLSVLKELPATLLLAPIGFKTLATSIWGSAEEGFFAQVGITSLVLIALSAVLTWLFVLRPGRFSSG